MSSENQGNKQGETRRISSAGSDRLGELHMGTPGDHFDAAEYQREMEVEAIFADKGRRASSGSDRLGELHTTVGAHLNAESYQKSVGEPIKE